MEQQVTVYDDKNMVLGMTFKRRARQLVMKERASWTDETCVSIRLASSEQKEKTSLDKAVPVSDLYIGNNPTQIANDKETFVMRETDGAYTDDELLRLARKRVRNKRNLIAHIVVYFSTFIVSLMLIAGWLGSYLRSTSINFYLGAMFTWGVFVASRIVLYFLPFIKNTKRFGRRDPVTTEYMKLKNMDNGRIAAEYEKL